MIWKHCTEVRLAGFLSGGFITAIIVNPPERKLAKRTSVDWWSKLVVQWGPDNQKTKHFHFLLQIQAETSLSIQQIPASTSLHRPSEACLCLDFQKKWKCLVFWLSGPHRTSNFDHQSLIHSDLNYTTQDSQSGSGESVSFIEKILPKNQRCHQRTPCQVGLHCRRRQTHYCKVDKSKYTNFWTIHTVPELNENGKISFGPRIRVISKPPIITRILYVRNYNQLFNTNHT